MKPAQRRFERDGHRRRGARGPRIPKSLVWLELLLHPRRYRLDGERYVDEISDTLLRYHEGGRSVVAGYEDLGKGEIGVYPGQIGPWEPARDHDGAPDDVERERIISMIGQAYARRGIVVADPAELVSSETGIAVLEDWNRRRGSSRD